MTDSQGDKGGAELHSILWSIVLGMAPICHLQSMSRGNNCGVNSISPLSIGTQGGQDRNFGSVYSGIRLRETANW